MRNLRHYTIHLTITAILAVLVALGYEDREHAALAIVCAGSAGLSLVVGVVFAVIAIRQRAKGQRWSALDWLATTSFVLGVLGVAALSVHGLLAASRADERPPASANTIIAFALAALVLAFAGVFVAVRHQGHSAAREPADS